MAGQLAVQHVQVPKELRSADEAIHTQGIENKLDYIQDLGMDAIWISPVTENRDSGYAYHGYWPSDPYNINTKFGSSDDLTSLSNALHARGMSLMVDFVINDLSMDSETDFGSFPAPFNTASAFHPACNIDWTNETSAQFCWFSVDPAGSLPDVDTENKSVWTAMVQTVVDMVTKYNIDGVRLDCARCMPAQALSQLQQALGSTFVIGEDYESAVSTVASYQGPLDSVLNFPLWYSLDVFWGGGSFSTLAQTLESENTTFQDTTILGNFLDNHDLPRVANVQPDAAIQQNAIVTAFFVGGIPIVYYGFEQSYTGGGNGADREPLWTSGYNQDAPMYTFTATLNHVRQNLASVMGSAASWASTKADILTVRDNALAFSRGPMVVVTTNVGSGGSTSVDLTGTQFKNGDTIIDMLSCETATVGQGGSFTSQSNAGQARLWTFYTQKGAFCQ